MKFWEFKSAELTANLLLGGVDVAREDGMWKLSGTWTKTDRRGDQKTGSWSAAAAPENGGGWDLQCLLFLLIRVSVTRNSSVMANKEGEANKEHTWTHGEQRTSHGESGES